MNKALSFLKKGGYLLAPPLILLLLVLLGRALLSPEILPPAEERRYPIIDQDNQVIGQYSPPSDLTIRDEPNAEEILYGKRLHTDTKRLLPDHVGAMMNCNSCHIAGGKAEYGAHYINTRQSYPRVMPRAGREVDLAGRINGCFQRSMNGSPLHPDSAEMGAMIAYIDWLSRSVPEGATVDIPIAGEIDTSLTPDPIRGEVIYHQNCATCHGANGEGLKDERGDIIFPPLWGDESFNIGAGMARTYKAAAFVQFAMPMSVNHQGLWGQGGILDAQDAVDVAEFFTHQPRPDFQGKVNDWPNGNRPKDARY